jgi:hypothetical protein
LRYFFRTSIPPLTRVLLVESGSRSILEKMIVAFRRVCAYSGEIDVVTCYAGVPTGADGKIFRVADYPTPSAREALYKELAARGYSAIAIICAAEPIMTKWKFALAARVPAKLLIINENADFFWCDRSNRKILTHLMLYRAGMTGASAAPTLARLLVLPLTAAYLLLYAGTVHCKRKLRA